MTKKNQIAQHALRLLAARCPRVTERLQAWTDAAIAADLAGYPEVDPKEAGRTRDRLLTWLKTLAHRGEGSGG